MEKYSRYIDKDGRILIVLARWCNLVDGFSVPTTIDILIYNEEREVSYPFVEFEKWINKKLITRVNN